MATHVLIRSYTGLSPLRAVSFACAARSDAGAMSGEFFKSGAGVACSQPVGVGEAARESEVSQEPWIGLGRSNHEGSIERHIVEPGVHGFLERLAGTWSKAAHRVIRSQSCGRPEGAPKIRTV